MKATSPTRRWTLATDLAAAGAIGALVVHPVTQDRDPATAAARLEEACGLSRALDLDVRSAESVVLRKVNPGSYFGGGRVELLAEEVKARDAAVVVVDAALTPVQQRNLEKGLNAKVVDRAGLILEIFGRRAATREGRLQVELARLGYERSRLVRTWTHLERQRGGLGKTGGPGETQIELDRRLIADRIVRLKKDLEEVRRTRGLQRRARTRAGLPTAALVGYTNAGKSTLFNRLTQADVLAKDMLFATLDPTARVIRMPGGRDVILSDTVGFITDLPTELIAAFRATLEAIVEADVIIHVRDIADPHTERQRGDVLGVLEQISKEKLEAGEALPPVLEVWNKIDQVEPDVRAARVARALGEAEGAVGPALVVSALSGEGMDDLLEAIDRLAYGDRVVVHVSLDPANGRTHAWIGAHGQILQETLGEDGLLHIVARLSVSDAAQLDHGDEP